jgi:hypothetical protein
LNSRLKQIRRFFDWREVRAEVVYRFECSMDGMPAEFFAIFAAAHAIREERHQPRRCFFHIGEIFIFFALCLVRARRVIELSPERW